MVFPRLPTSAFVPVGVNTLVVLTVVRHVPSIATACSRNRSNTHAFAASMLALTLNTYSHVLPAMQEDAASKMDAILPNAKS